MQKKYKVLKIRLDEKAIQRFDRAAFALEYFIEHEIPYNIGGIESEKAYKNHLAWFNKIVDDADKNIAEYEKHKHYKENTNMANSVITAENLMIGDLMWIGKTKSNMDGDYDVSYIQERITLDHFKFWADNDWNKSDFAEFVRPIDLQNNIQLLEINSFERRGGGNFCHSFEYGRYIEVINCYLPINKEEPLTVTIKKGDYRNFMVECRLQIHYMHELQHAIRMCGTNDENIIKNVCQ